jgi:transcriptional regulator with XRE-family HTH domain
VANFPGPKHVAQVGAYIREQRENAQYSLRQLALAAGVSNPYLSQIERGLRKPSAEILQQLAKALEISSETLYIRAGLLDPEPEDDVDAAGAQSGTSEPGTVPVRGNRVLAAIREDALLTRRQKQVLIDIYESYRAPSGMDARDGQADSEADSSTDSHGDSGAGNDADADVTSTTTTTTTNPN